MNLSAPAVELIQKFIDARWFASVGNPLEDDTVVLVDSWGQAMERCLSDDWVVNARWDAENALTLTLHKNHCDRYQDWNKIIRAVNSQLMPNIKSVGKQAIKEHQLPGEFSEFLIHTTRLGCVEAQYSDILAPGFFSGMARWYLAGHLPCGYAGKFPNGKLCVF